MIALALPVGGRSLLTSFPPVWLCLWPSASGCRIFPGSSTRSCSATTASGHRVSIVHYWNHVDFYTTEARVNSPDGVTSTTLIDGDAGKTWGATLEIDPSQKSATYWIPDGRTGMLIW